MKKRYVAVAVTGLALAAGLWIYRTASAHETDSYRFATITRGSVQSTVSATGALSAVTTVQVGTQVSGQVSAIYTDFNDRVKKGQLLARIDPTLAQQAVVDAQAGLQRVQAQLAQTQQVYGQDKQLYDEQVITATEFTAAQANYTVAQANVKSAQVALDKARQNLSYTSITAPIDGVVVERDVNVGQTVAASFSAPQLFLIANNLSQMQILASVDESDIGQIKVGQPVHFTVQAYPARTFSGTVKQVRLQSTTTDNVVNYTAVITVQNLDGALLPGMTATVSFLTGSATNVLLVPNAALRFRATPTMLASLKSSRSAGGAARANSTPGSDSTSRHTSAGAARAAATGAASTRRGASGAARPTTAMLWYVGADGAPTATRVRTGLSDGQQTQIQGSGVTEGMQVITAVTQPGAQSASAAPATSNPFQPQGRGGYRRGGF